MARNTWHIQKDAQSVTVSRRLPARFDAMAEATLPAGNKLRLAQQIRQDMWRLLQELRGFAPVVEVRDTENGLRVRAGGQIEGRYPRADVEARIAGLLADPAKRARWSRFASQTRGQADG